MSSSANVYRLPAGRYRKPPNSQPTIQLPHVLRPKHFKDLRTQLGATGLRFAATIGHFEREAACLSFGDTFGDVDTPPQQFARRWPTKVVLHPRYPSASQLLELLKDAQKRDLPGEKVNIGYGMDGTYKRCWLREVDEDGDHSESEPLVLVAFDQTEPIGYAGMEVSMTLDRPHRDAYLFIEAKLVYVLPKRRGHGYGIDLSIACGMICEDLLVATYRAVPSGSTLGGCVWADYESAGGEAITRYMHDSLTCQAEQLKESGRRASVRLAEFQLDAGY